MKLDRQVLEKYLALEKSSRALEVKDVMKIYKMKERQLKDLNETVKQLEEHYKACVKQT